LQRAGQILCNLSHALPEPPPDSAANVREQVAAHRCHGLGRDTARSPTSQVRRKVLPTRQHLLSLSRSIHSARSREVDKLRPLLTDKCPTARVPTTLSERRNVRNRRKPRIRINRLSDTIEPSLQAIISDMIDNPVNRYTELVSDTAPRPPQSIDPAANHVWQGPRNKPAERVKHRFNVVAPHISEDLRKATPHISDTVNGRTNEPLIQEPNSAAKRINRGTDDAMPGRTEGDRQLPPAILNESQRRLQHVTP